MRDLEKRKILSDFYKSNGGTSVLETAEKIEFKKAIRMTELGQMLVNEGIQQEKLRIAKNLIGILDEEMIAKQTELPLKTVLELKGKPESVSSL